MQLILNIADTQDNLIAGRDDRSRDLARLRATQSRIGELLALHSNQDDVADVYTQRPSYGLCRQPDDVLRLILSRWHSRRVSGRVGQGRHQCGFLY